MSIHIEAKKGEIAEGVLLPGDPLRAKYIAETFLSDISCYNNVRGMLGFTGLYEGKRVSVQGTGMGQPSAAIYINELISFYGVKKLIRIGSCGSIQPELRLRDVIIALAGSTDSNMNKNRFAGYDYAATADSELLFSAYEFIKTNDMKVKFGNILSSDTFYSDDPNEWNMWAKFGVQAIEMETSQLYTLAAKFGVQALSVLTVSDSLTSQEETTAQEREKTFNDMISIALNII